jgi:excisionase family DNA binding protein
LEKIVSDPSETFLTVAEVAQRLKLNQQTVRNWIDQGSLPAVRVGRRVRIKQSDFDRIVEEGYRPVSGVAGERGPSAADFWSGRPVGEAEPAPARETGSDQTGGAQVNGSHGVDGVRRGASTGESA